MFGHDGTGIVVDTHVHRVAQKLGWVDRTTAKRRGPEETRRQLERWVPKGTWTDFTTAVVGFGQLTRTGAEWATRFLRWAAREYGEESEQSTRAAIIAAKLSST